MDNKDNKNINPEAQEQNAEKETGSKNNKGCARKDERKVKKELEKKVEDLEAQVAKDKDDYLRLMAEFDNFRRRSAQDRLELVSTASEDIIKGLLPVLDDFERAMQVLRESDASDAAKEGTELIYNKLLSYLKSKGVEKIDALGKEFNTDLHEAVTQFPVDDEEKKGKVYDIVQTGYTLRGKVIRFSKVVVAI